MALGLPRTTTDRALTDIGALGLATRSKSGGDTSPNLWLLTTEARELVAGIVGNPHG